MNLIYLSLLSLLNENKSCIFIVLIYKESQTIIAMITESKVVGSFCMADDLASLIFNFASFLMQ